VLLLASIILPGAPTRISTALSSIAMNVAPPLAGRRAAVSGGGRGIGAAIAHELAGRGAHVIVIARTRTEVERVAAEVGGTALVADVADPGFAAALAAVGPVDVVVANAGVIGPLGRFAETSVADWAAAVTVNLHGAVQLVHAVLPGMLERGWGRIATISSGAATPPGMPSANAYSTSKAALDMFTLHLAKELEGTGVTASAVRPGVVDTDMQVEMRAAPRDRVGAEFHDRFHGLHERGELTDAPEAARYVVDVIVSGVSGRVLDRRTDAVPEQP
jgi:NAD(P)-dependent dehydrogenase (short-subunit alcohol dehydrogenase family)